MSYGKYIRSVGPPKRPGYGIQDLVKLERNYKIPGPPSTERIKGAITAKRFQKRAPQILRYEKKDPCFDLWSKLLDCYTHSEFSEELCAAQEGALTHCRETIGTAKIQRKAFASRRFHLRELSTMQKRQRNGGGLKM